MSDSSSGQLSRTSSLKGSTKRRLFGAPKTELILVLLQQKTSNVQQEEDDASTDSKQKKPVVVGPIVVELKEGINQLGRTEVQRLQAKYPQQMFDTMVTDYVLSKQDIGSPNIKKKNKLSRNQVSIKVQRGAMYNHATIQLMGANPSVLQRITETGHLERFYMEKDKVYQIHPGDVIYLLKGLYPFRVEERLMKVDQSQNSLRRIPSSRSEDVNTQLLQEDEEQRENKESDDSDDADSNEDLQITDDMIENEEDFMKIYKKLKKKTKKEQKQMEQLKYELEQLSVEVFKEREVKSPWGRHSGEFTKVINNNSNDSNSNMVSYNLSYSTGSSSSSSSSRNRGRSLGNHDDKGSNLLSTKTSGELILPSKQLRKERLQKGRSSSPRSSTSDLIALADNTSNGTDTNQSGSSGVSGGSGSSPSVSSRVLHIQRNKITRQRSYTALNPIGTATLMSSSTSSSSNSSESQSYKVKKKSIGGLSSFFIPIVPGMRLEVKKVLEFQMTQKTKDQLALLKLSKKGSTNSLPSSPISTPRSSTASSK